LYARNLAGALRCRRSSIFTGDIAGREPNWPDHLNIATASPGGTY
jgi:hypothetical protein